MEIKTINNDEITFYGAEFNGTLIGLRIYNEVLNEEKGANKVDVCVTVGKEGGEHRVLYHREYFKKAIPNFRVGELSNSIGEGIFIGIDKCDIISTIQEFDKEYYISFTANGLDWNTKEIGFYIVDIRLDKESQSINSFDCSWIESSCNLDIKD